MRILVTGGAGFIGGHLCDELLNRPGVTHVVAIDDFSTGLAANLSGKDVELVNGSILDRPLIEAIVARMDAVVHLAARPSVPRSLADPMATHLVNATGTVNVLEACRKRSTAIIVASSSSVYGSAPGLPRHEKLPTRPMSPYAASKLAAESYALGWGAAFGLPVLAFRFFNVYGPRQRADHAYAAVIPRFIDAALRGEALRVHGDGLQTRDFTYVGTVVRVLADATLRRVTHPAPVNLAFGNRVPVIEIAKRISVLLDRPVGLVHEAPRPGDVRDSQASEETLRALFPQIAPIGLDEGLERTVAWFRG